jgi:hypothetical protein
MKTLITVLCLGLSSYASACTMDEAQAKVVANIIGNHDEVKNLKINTSQDSLMIANVTVNLSIYSYSSKDTMNDGTVFEMDMAGFEMRSVADCSVVEGSGTSIYPVEL